MTVIFPVHREIPANHNADKIFMMPAYPYQYFHVAGIFTHEGVENTETPPGQGCSNEDPEALFSFGSGPPAVLIFSVNKIFDQNIKINRGSTYIPTSDFKQQLIRDRNRFHL